MAGYLTEMKISEDSPLIGSTCQDRNVNQSYDVIVLDIQREGRLITYNVGRQILKEGDILFVKGSVESFLRMKEVEKVGLLTDEKLTQTELEQDDNILVECMISDQSDVVGKTLRESRFRKRFGAFILAIRREGLIIRKKIAHVVLNTYDTLLVYGGKRQISELAESGKFILLGELQADLVKVRFWWLSIICVVMTILLAAIGIIPIIKLSLIHI